MTSQSGSQLPASSPQPPKSAAPPLAPWENAKLDWEHAALLFAEKWAASIDNRNKAVVAVENAEQYRVWADSSMICAGDVRDPQNA